MKPLPVRPADVPPPPEGYVYVGTAPFPDNRSEEFHLAAWDQTEGWHTHDGYWGHVRGLHFAVKPGTPAALKLGVTEADLPVVPEPEPAPVSDPTPETRYGHMLSQIGSAIPEEFFAHSESTTLEAVNLLLRRYYSVMSEILELRAELRELKGGAL